MMSDLNKDDKDIEEVDILINHSDPDEEEPEEEEPEEEDPDLDEPDLEW